MKNSIAEKIADLRKKKGWSQDQLSKAAHLSRLVINKFERGKMIPTAESSKKLADAFGLPDDFFLTSQSDIETAQRTVVPLASIPGKEFRKKLLKATLFPVADQKLVTDLLDHILEKHEMAARLDDIKERSSGRSR